MKLHSHIQRFITGTVLATGFWFIFFYFPPIFFSLLLITILFIILIKEWPIFFKYNSYLFWAIMPVYPILPFALLIAMNHNPDHRILLYYLFLTVFSFDTSAYLTGTVIGYHKIIPHVSPHKTVEGSIGGLIGAFIMFNISLWEQNVHLDFTIRFLLVSIICIVAFFGDIFESMLKRKAFIKHSGKFLPGHGGFLDRFDAVMMVALFFYVFRNGLSSILK